MIIPLNTNGYKPVIVITEAFLVTRHAGATPQPIKQIHVIHESLIRKCNDSGNSENQDSPVAFPGTILFLPIRMPEVSCPLASRSS